MARAPRAAPAAQVEALEPSTPGALFEAALDPRRSAHHVRNRVVRAWRITWARMTPLGGITDGNRIEVYFDGDDAFGAMFQAIEGAERRVWLETYIYEDDAIGRGVKDRLLDAVRRGCEVVLLYDPWGSSDLPAGYFRDLEEQGARVVPFNPLHFRLPWKVSPWVRDHRKVLIVDDVIGFCGGMNVSEDYAGDALGRGRFRDSHARLEGPCVKHLGDIFLESYRLAARERWVPERAQPPRHASASSPRGSLVQVLRSNVLLKRTQIQRALRQSISRSVERCWLTSPYFIPPGRILRRLIRAAQRGVDVRVLTAGISDVPAARRASEYLYGKLLRHGVRIFELRPRTLHAKTAVIDGLYSTVGSFNLDTWSFRRNLEVNVAVVDPALAHRLEAQFEADLAGSEEVTLERWRGRSWWRRFVDWLAYQLARI